MSTHRTHKIEVERLADFCNPYEVSPWYGCSIRKAQVTKALASLDFETRSYSDSFTLGRTRDVSSSYHARRIAYLVANKSTWEPIHIDVGVPSLGCLFSWLVEDGNHRLAAAIWRGDKHVDALIFGDLNYARWLLFPRRARIRAAC